LSFWNVTKNIWGVIKKKSLNNHLRNKKLLIFFGARHGKNIRYGIGEKDVKRQILERRGTNIRYGY